MNTATLVLVYQAYIDAYHNSPMISMGDTGVHVQDERMDEIAPLEQWTVNIHKGAARLFSWQHEVILHGVKFYCLTTDPIEGGDHSSHTVDSACPYCYVPEDQREVIATVELTEVDNEYFESENEQARREQASK